MLSKGSAEGGATSIQGINDNYSSECKRFVDNVNIFTAIKSKLQKCEFKNVHKVNLG